MFQSLKNRLFAPKNPGPMKVIMRHPLLDRPVKDLVSTLAKEQIKRSSLFNTDQSVFISSEDLVFGLPEISLSKIYPSILALADPAIGIIELNTIKGSNEELILLGIRINPDYIVDGKLKLPHEIKAQVEVLGSFLDLDCFHISASHPSIKAFIIRHNLHTGIYTFEDLRNLESKLAKAA